MLASLSLLANAAATLGILMCILAGSFRISGNFYIGSIEALTLFNVGVGLMVFSCLAKLELLLRSR